MHDSICLFQNKIKTYIGRKPARKIRLHMYEPLKTHLNFAFGKFKLVLRTTMGYSSEPEPHILGARYFHFHIIE